MTFNQLPSEKVFCVFSVILVEGKLTREEDGNTNCDIRQRERERESVAFAQLVAELRPSRRVVRPVVT